MRDRAGLVSALEEMSGLQGGPALENSLAIARLVAFGALKREESRGGHFRSDFPAADPAFATRSYLTLAEATPSIDDIIRQDTVPRAIISQESQT